MVDTFSLPPCCKERCSYQVCVMSTTPLSKRGMGGAGAGSGGGGRNYWVGD